MPVACSAAAAVTRLSNGVEMPLLAFGTWQILGQQAYDATLAALREGYRHIDTAQLYQNEREVGRAIRDSGVPRGEVFLATKISEQADFRQLKPAFERQLQSLGVDYVDLYMLHSPGSKADNEAAWRDMEALHAAGKIRALGVSNFDSTALEELLQTARTPPVYLQNKMSVFAPGEQRVPQDTSILAFCRARQIQVMAYSVNNPWPLALRPLQDPHVLAVAKRAGRTPAQVLLRWALQLGSGVIAKSVTTARIQENFRLFDFALPEADVAILSALATLSESTAGRFSPLWIDDVYDLKGLPELG